MPMHTATWEINPILAIDVLTSMSVISLVLTHSLRRGSTLLALNFGSAQQFPNRLSVRPLAPGPAVHRTRPAPAVVTCPTRLGGRGSDVRSDISTTEAQSHVQQPRRDTAPSSACQSGRRVHRGSPGLRRIRARAVPGDRDLRQTTRRASERIDRGGRAVRSRPRPPERARAARGGHHAIVPGRWDRRGCPSRRRPPR